VAGRPLNPDPDFDCDPDFDENSAPCLRKALSPAGRARRVVPCRVFRARRRGPRRTLGSSGTEVPAPCAPCGRGNASGAAARRRDFSPSLGGAPSREPSRPCLRRALSPAGRGLLCVVLNETRYRAMRLRARDRAVRGRGVKPLLQGNLPAHFSISCRRGFTPRPLNLDCDSDPDSDESAP